MRRWLIVRDTGWGGRHSDPCAAFQPRPYCQRWTPPDIRQRGDSGNYFPGHSPRASDKLRCHRGHRPCSPLPRSGKSKWQYRCLQNKQYSACFPNCKWFHRNWHRHSRSRGGCKSVNPAPWWGAPSSASLAPWQAPHILMEYDLRDLCRWRDMRNCKDSLDARKR